MDGKLLALARNEKDNIRRAAEQTDRRRHAEVYARVPELRRLDDQIASLIPQAAAAALGGGRSISELRAESLELQARRAELLVENGWPINYLDGAWDCPRCRDTGYVEGHMCSCLKRLYEKAQTRDLSALLKLGNESFGTFDLGLYDDRPDPAAGIAPRTQMETVFGICYDYAINFKGKHTYNLLLRGDPGLGKTFLSACIAREVAKQGYSVVYETAVGAVAAERERFSRSEDESARADAQVRRMMECDLLILDDLGTEAAGTDFARSALYTLINTRLIGRKKTVISTNLTASQLRERYTPQIASRLEGEYQVLPFAGTDIRMLKKERGLD